MAVTIGANEPFEEPVDEINPFQSPVVDDLQFIWLKGFNRDFLRDLPPRR